jgi:hypothetical protein
MTKIGEQDENNDVLDIRIRFLRRESPMLFRAIEKFSGRPGDRARNSFIRNLMEMGLVVQEERMRRMDGISTRALSGLVDGVVGAVSNVRRDAAAEHAAPSGTEIQAPATEESSVTATPRIATTNPAPAPAAAQSGPSDHGAEVEGSVTQSRPTHASGAHGRDDDRPPPRVAGAYTPRRMLAGETLE